MEPAPTQNRRELERRYIEKMTELQVWWKNTVGPEDFNDIHEIDDDRLRAGIKGCTDQLLFERWLLRPVQIALAIGVPLGLLYGLVRFVKWAWTD